MKKSQHISFEWQMIEHVVNIDVKSIDDKEKFSSGKFERMGVVILDDGETTFFKIQGIIFGIFDTKTEFTDVKSLGYIVFYFNDNSKIIAEISGSEKVTSTDQPRIFTGKGKFLKGTEKFKGIKGSFTFEGSYVDSSLDKSEQFSRTKLIGEYIL
ncbi:MAG: hypothetical protein PVI75_00560 [Gammaproteobacteria bacterium]|jgi:hypothetical protein